MVNSIKKSKSQNRVQNEKLKSNSGKKQEEKPDRPVEP